MTTARTTERVQLHSALGRLLYFLASLFFLEGLASVGVVAWFSYQEGKLNPGILLMVLYGIPTFFISSWARRYRGRIWATAAGLELGTPAVLVPWQDVAQVKNVPLLSVLQPFYLITFKDNRVPLGFYACADADRISSRFQSSTSAPA